MGWTSEFWLMSSEENNKLWQMWIYQLELENTQIVLGEIQRCSKQSVDIARLQMQTAGFDKCKMAEPTNPDICSEQIHMYDFDKSTRAHYTDVIFETWHMHKLERSVIQIITHIEVMIGHNHFDDQIDVKIINEIHILAKWLSGG